MSHYAIVIDSSLCTGCMSCVVSCKQENNVALGEYWNMVKLVGPSGTFPEVEEYFMPLMCQQCQDAPCVHACPTGASYRDPETNVVLVNKEVCIGCKYCMMACPYGVRAWNEEEGCVEKCTLCQQLTQAGDQPACVKNCPSACRFYGDLDDPNSDVSKVLAKAGSDTVHSLPDTGNHPSTRYLLRSDIATWKEGA